MENERLMQLELAKAEAEKRKVNAGSCALCQKSLAGIKALDVFDRRCCSSACVLQLRRKLTAEAAEKRLQGTGSKT